MQEGGFADIKLIFFEFCSIPAEGEYRFAVQEGGFAEIKLIFFEFCSIPAEGEYRFAMTGSLLESRFL